MKNKLYSLILMIFCCGLWTARAQDSTSCNARFTASVSGNQVFFLAVDSASGVQHYWAFGDTSHIGYGPYPTVTHTYAGPGSYRVTHLIIDTAHGCHDSSSQLITISAPPPQCSITFTYSHDSTHPNSPYIFTAHPSLAGATADTITWTLNDTLVARGSMMLRLLHAGTNTVCVNMVTNLGCRSQFCQTIVIGDTTHCSVSFSYIADTAFPYAYRFYAQPSPVSVADSIVWTSNGVSFGDRDSTLHLFNQTGVYNVCVTLTVAGCQSQSCQTIVVGDSSSTDSSSTVAPPSDSALSIRSYPNPAYSSTNLVIGLDKSSMIYIRVYNSMGTQVGMKTVSGLAGTNVVSLPMGALQPGIYYIQVQYGNEVKRGRIQKL